jgi:8-oxo-dGTP pyrophosphatase MutT (NUDIX family)
LSLHADARAVLAGWDPPEQSQAELRALFLRHLAGHPDAMSRRCRDHLTASAIVVEPDTMRVLLTFHGKAKRWLQLGGHCEEQDLTLAAAALREATEESGIADLVIDPTPIQLSRHEVAFCGPVQPAYHLDVQYVATCRPDPVEAFDPAADVVAWFDTGALPRHTDDAVRTLVNRAVRRLRGTLG